MKCFLFLFLSGTFLGSMVFAAASEVPSTIAVAAIDQIGSGVIRSNGDLALLSNTAISEAVNFPGIAKYKLAVLAYGTAVGGVYPNINVYANNILMGSLTVNSTTAKLFYLTADLNIFGIKNLRLEYTNDLKNATGDRNVYIRSISLSYVDSVAKIPSNLTIAKMSLKTTGSVMTDGSWRFLLNGSASNSVQFAKTGKHQFVISAYGTPAAGVYPKLGVYIDTHLIKTLDINSKTLKTFSFTYDLRVAGVRKLNLAYTNDGKTSTENRNLYIKSVSLAEAAVVTPPPSEPPPVEPPPTTPTTPVTVPLTLPALAYLPSSLGPRFPGNIEPAKACEAPAGNKCIYVDAAAASNGSGTQASPFKNLSSVSSIIQGGDYVYLTGNFTVTTANRLVLGAQANGPSKTKLTHVKSLPGKVRAKLNGQNTVNSLIEFNADTKNIQLSNIEILNSLGRGVAFSNSMSEMIIVEDMYIHHTQGDTGSAATLNESYGIGGGLFLNGPNSGSEIHVRNCFFEVNNLVNTLVAGVWRLVPTDRNNMGALSINSELYAADGSANFKVYNNIFNKESSGVRHKHPGNILTEAYNNLFMDSNKGLFIRSFKDNLIHHNVFYNISNGAMMEYNENTKGVLNAHFYNNNLFNSQMISNMPFPGTHKAYYYISNNFSHNTSSLAMVVSSPANYPDVHFSKNLFLHKDASRFFFKTDGNTLSQWISFTSFNADQSNSNFLSPAITTGTTDLANHNTAYAAQLNYLKANNIGAFK